MSDKKIRAKTKPEEETSLETPKEAGAEITSATGN
jgi:hypothetical protein